MTLNTKDPLHTVVNGVNHINLTHTHTIDVPRFASLINECRFLSFTLQRRRYALAHFRAATKYKKNSSCVSGGISRNVCVYLCGLDNTFVCMCAFCLFLGNSKHLFGWIGNIRTPTRFF